MGGACLYYVSGVDCGRQRRKWKTETARHEETAVCCLLWLWLTGGRFWFCCVWCLSSFLPAVCNAEPRSTERRQQSVPGPNVLPPRSTDDRMSSRNLLAGVLGNWWTQLRLGFGRGRLLIASKSGCFLSLLLPWSASVEFFLFSLYLWKQEKLYEGAVSVPSGRFQQTRLCEVLVTVQTSSDTRDLDAYSAELVLLNKQQIWGYLHCLLWQLRTPLFTVAIAYNVR